jgi:hypothetical protein
MNPIPERVRAYGCSNELTNIFLNLLLITTSRQLQPPQKKDSELVHFPIRNLHVDCQLHNEINTSI